MSDHTPDQLERAIIFADRDCPHVPGADCCECPLCIAIHVEQEVARATEPLYELLRRWQQADRGPHWARIAVEQERDAALAQEETNDE